MPRFGVRWLLAAALMLLLGGAFFFCEYLIYFPAILKCAWPRVEHARGGGGIDGRPADSPPVRAMVLSDTHLLGAVGGHWFDKLRRYAKKTNHKNNPQNKTPNNNDDDSNLVSFSD